MPDKTYKIIFSWTFEPSIHVAVHGSDIIIKKNCDDILKSGNDNQIFFVNNVSLLTFIKNHNKKCTKKDDSFREEILSFRESFFTWFFYYSIP